MIDLHTHTRASDGSETPAELVRLAKAAGLCAVAVTDHDTTDGVSEALLAGEKLGIEVVPGVELSCNWEREMHILGLYINHEHPKLKAALSDLAEKRSRRNRKTLARLNELGLSVTEEDVLKVATGKIWGRAHFAKVLCDKGYVESVKDGFRKYLGHGRPAHINEERLEPEEAISLIRSSGGVPILAHMHYLKLELPELKALLIRLKQAGLMGAEAIYTEYTGEQTREYTRLIEELGLLKSGGSDFHGEMKPQITLDCHNLNVPYSYLKEIKQYVRTF
ncbi:MAG: PHP domain-containing protein [Clostridia bacterium]|nr:PHP domain-containing protein [Clostridia bacterium]